MKLFLLGALSAASIAGAQAPITPVAVRDIGQTVRVTELNGATVSGTLREVNATALVVEPALGRMESVDLSGVKRFEVREPISPAQRTTRGWWGLVAGTLVGAGAGYLVAIPRVHHAEDVRAQHPQLDYLFDPIVGGVVGGATGLAIGRYPVHMWVVRYP